LTLSVDPRIKRIKQEEKEVREAKKKIKGGVPINQKARQEQDKRHAEEEAKRKEEEEKVSYSFHYLVDSPGLSLSQVARAEAKKAKAAAANAAKKTRRQERAAQENGAAS
jgi:DnaJ homolog subfamily C member 2